MSEEKITFDDGAAYERFMGQWSRLAGEVFLAWLAPKQGLSWIDVGCGNGAFTELLLERAAPAKIEGIDPSDGQLRYARTRLEGWPVTFQIGDAMDLPFTEDTFDAAIMALVIFFVPTPEQGVAEMVRVTKAGGQVSAYAWDVLGGALPMEPMLQELTALGMTPLRPPRSDISTLEALHDLWTGAGLNEVETRSFTVERSFKTFDELWESYMGAASLATALAKLSSTELESLKSRLMERLGSGPDGSIRYSARANAVKGRV